MTLWAEMARASNNAGDEIILRRRDEIYEIRFNGLELMSSFNYQSETVLAERSLRLHGNSTKRVLIGGLGMGFTLRTALNYLNNDAEVIVCELVPEIVEWNQKYFGHLANNPLADERVTVHVGDVREALSGQGSVYDVILMDTDNGPDILVREDNVNIYMRDGLEAVSQSLNPGGIAAFWSAEISDDFETRLDEMPWDWHRDDICLAGGRADAFHHIYFAQVKQTHS